MCGGGYSPPPQPYAQRVTWVPSDYTRFEDGDWFADPNRHFIWEGKRYYITDEDDIENPETWRQDTAYLHTSAAEYQAMQARRREMEAAAKYQESLLGQMVERNRIMSQSLAEQKKRLAEEKEAKEKARQEDEARRKKRLKLAALGNGLLLHGGRGVTGAANLYRPTLGAA